VVEDAPTFEGNARKKAMELAKWLARITPPQGLAWENSLVLADDSGLEVDVLHGAPGVHSARFAALGHQVEAATAGNTPDAANNAKLLRLLEKVPAEQRTARFRCLLAVASVKGSREVKVFDGRCEGTIGFAPKGKGGFGYDPLFIPAGFKKSFAELGEKTKNRLSHRANAVTKLKVYLS
jgi:XTP/dITP diphosphohydrolase